MKNICCRLIFIFFLSVSASAQDSTIFRINYIGLQPSILVEPYDTVNAIEVNIIPIVLDRKISANSSIQLRSIVNYRFLEGGNGISQVGATVLYIQYFSTIFSNVQFLTPYLAPYVTYAENQLDKVKTLTLGMELGGKFTFTRRISLSTSVQPGINYYPNPRNTAIIGPSAWKGHFGIIVHGGISF